MNEHILNPARPALARVLAAVTARDAAWWAEVCRGRRVWVADRVYVRPVGPVAAEDDVVVPFTVADPAAAWRAVGLPEEGLGVLKHRRFRDRRGDLHETPPTVGAAVALASAADAMVEAEAAVRAVAQGLGWAAGLPDPIVWQVWDRDVILNAALDLAIRWSQLHPALCGPTDVVRGIAGAMVLDNDAACLDPAAWADEPVGVACAPALRTLALTGMALLDLSPMRAVLACPAVRL